MDDGREEEGDSENGDADQAVGGRLENSFIAPVTPPLRGAFYLQWQFASSN